MNGVCPDCGHPWDEHQMHSPIRTEKRDGIVWYTGQHGRDGCTHRVWTANNLPRQCGCGKVEFKASDFWLGLEGDQG